MMLVFILVGVELPLCLGERNWREDEWRGEFDQSDSILFVCQRRENSSSSNLIIVYISSEFYIEFPAAHRYPWCNAQSKSALSRSPSTVVTLSWNAMTCFLESSWLYDRFVLFQECCKCSSGRPSRIVAPCWRFLYTAVEQKLAIFTSKRNSEINAFLSVYFVPFSFWEPDTTSTRWFCYESETNQRSDLIWMSSFAGPSYLTMRSSVYIILIWDPCIFNIYNLCQIRSSCIRRKPRQCGLHFNEKNNKNTLPLVTALY